MTLKKLIIASSIVVGIVLVTFYIYKMDSLVPANPDKRVPEDGTKTSKGTISISGKGSQKDMESLIKFFSDRMEPPKEISGKDGAESMIEWIEFESSEGGFSVLLPNTPAKTTSESIQTEFSSVSGDFSYAIAYTDIKERTQDANAILDEVGKPIKGIKQLSQSNLSINGFAGREVVSEITGSRWMVKRRWFVVNDRSYFLSVQFPKREAFPNIAEVDRFLNSFKVLGQESDVSDQN